MDIRRTLISAALMLVIVLGWEMLAARLYKKYPSLNPQTAATTQPAATTAPALARAGVGSSPATMPTTAPAIAATTTGLHAVAVGGSSPIISVGSDIHASHGFSVGLNTSATGAGLSSVTLNRFYETAQDKALYSFQKPLADGPDGGTALASRSVSIDGHDIDLSGAQWKKSATDSTSITYTATIDDRHKPVLRIDKTYSVPKATIKNGSQGYDTLLSERFDNLTSKPIKLHAEFNGPTPPPRENDREEDRQLIAGYNDGDHVVAVAHAFITEFKEGKLTKDFVAIDKRPLLWIGTCSSYFNAVVRPVAMPGEPIVPFASAIGTALNPTSANDDRQVQLTLQTDDFTVAHQASKIVNYRVFFGPKERELLSNPYYSAFPMSYDETLVYSGGFCGFLTFQWLISVLYWILASFHFIFRDWGLAIIGLVCLVRLCLHPITKKSQINMMSMGKMGPEIERLKKKYGDDKEGLNKAMMGVYKTQGLSPVLGCLPMLLQMPIWIALWSALQSTFALRQAPFLRFGWLHLTYIKDLSQPDFLVHFSHSVPLIFGMSISGINVLPILMAGVYFGQQKMMPVPPNQTPEQIQQRKMMSYMSLLFPVFLYTAPSGLNLYILTSTSIGIFESKIVRDHIKARDEAEKAGKVFVGTTATRASKQNKKEADTARIKGVKPKGVMGFLADLQAKAEEIRRDSGR